MTNAIACWPCAARMHHLTSPFLSSLSPSLLPSFPTHPTRPSCWQALAHSPQFHQQLGTFSAALQTGQLDLAQFGLQAEVRAEGMHASVWVFGCVSVCDGGLAEAPHTQHSHSLRRKVTLQQWHSTAVSHWCVVLEEVCSCITAL